MQIETRRFPVVTPAQAGVQGNGVLLPWIPAFAGMTMRIYAIML